MKQGKRKAENEIDNKHQKKEKVVTSSSKNDEWSYHDFGCDEDVPLPKKGSELSGCEDDSTSAEDDASSSSDGSSSSAEDDASSSSDGSSSSAEDDASYSSDGSSSSAEEDVGVNKEPAASVKEESSGEGLDVNVNKAPASSDDHVKEKAVDDCGRQEEWKENEREFLIAILYAELVIHEKDVNQLDWEGVVQKLYHQTRKQTSVTQVQTFYKKFKDETTQFMDLLQVTDYEWNPSNNKVTCKDDVWEHIYWIHGGQKTFRTKGLLHYHLLRDIFGSGSKQFVQESDVQRAPPTPLTLTTFWSWLFG